jgi:hypothetical protein
MEIKQRPKLILSTEDEEIIMKARNLFQDWDGHIDQHESGCEMCPLHEKCNGCEVEQVKDLLTQIFEMI